MVALQNFSIRFPHSGAKFGQIKIFASLQNIFVPVCVWLELITMICCGASLLAVTRRATTEGKRHNFPGAEWCGGHRKVLTMSQVLQCSTFASERPQVWTWGLQACFLPRVPSNLVTPQAAIQYSSALSTYIEWGVAQCIIRSLFFELIEHVQCIFVT